MALAIIGGLPARFATYAQLYRDVYAKAGHDMKMLQGINSHTYIADTSQRAADEFYPHYADVMSRIGQESGFLVVKMFHAKIAKKGSNSFRVFPCL
jgi:hypothetical protein